MRTLIYIVLTTITLYSQNLVVKVYDGDTFQIDTGEKVRLLGIDTPEKWDSGKMKNDIERTGKDKETIEKLGQLASEYTENMLLNRTVYLVADTTNNNMDKYGRLLRYAYLEDGTFYNLLIIQDGYAFAYTKFNFIYLDEFLEAQRIARENQNGLWKDDNFDDIKN